MGSPRGFVFYYNYDEVLQDLSDEKLGLLVRAIVAYGRDGTEIEMDGETRIAFRFIARDLDRDTEKYEERCERNFKNGAKGGRPKKEKESGFDENPQKPKEPTGFCENPEKPIINKNININKKININNTPLNPPKGNEGAEKTDDILAGYQFTEQMESAVREWLQYKAERREGYKPTGLRNFLSQVQNKCKAYPESVIINEMRTSMANGWRGIIWERLEEKKQTTKDGKIWNELT